MKISKLFHWLYAILMFAPVCAVGITCLTHVFNEEVQAETQTVEVEYQYENNVNPNTEININTLYKVVPPSSYQFIEYYNYIVAVNKSTNKIDFEFNNYYNTEFEVNWQSYPSIYVGSSYVELIYDEFYASYSDYDIYVSFYGEEYIQNNMATLQSFLDITSYNGPIENVDITTVAQDDSTNIFYTSCEQVKDSFVLNWCNYNNPTRAVFDYGSALFNVDSDNLVNYFLTYWCSISIIWLVFDVFMYVPLLVHRWIDKAKIE